MVDYWKDVPGIDEASGDAKNYLSRDVIKQMIKSGKWEVHSGDANGKTGSSLVMRSHTGKRRAVIIESNTDEVRSIRQELTKAANALSRMSSKDKRFKKAEALVDQARKLLFDLQD